MTPRRLPYLRAVRLTTAVLAHLALAGCAVPPPSPTPQAAGTRPAWTATRIAQIGHGEKAHFVRCLAPVCPTVTPKTLHLVAGASLSETPQPANLAATETTSSQASPRVAPVAVESAADGEADRDTANDSAAQRPTLAALTPSTPSDARPPSRLAPEHVRGNSRCAKNKPAATSGKPNKPSLKSRTSAARRGAQGTPCVQARARSLLPATTLPSRLTR